MSSQPSRSYLAIAAAIVIAGVLISASLFVAVGQAARTTTSVVSTTITDTCSPALGSPQAIFTFIAQVNYSGPWNATLTAYSNGGMVFTQCYFGSGVGDAFLSDWNPNGTASLLVRAQKADGGSGNLTLELQDLTDEATNSTVAPFGSASLSMSTAPIASIDLTRPGPTMTVNGSSYYADNITSDITMGFPGYSYFDNASVTFLGVKFETYCPLSYEGCPAPPGTTRTITYTTMSLGIVGLNITFPDKITEHISAPIGDDDYIFAFTHHTDPQAGVLIVYNGGFEAYLLVSVART